MAITNLQYNHLEHPWPSKLRPVSDFSYHSWTHEVSNKITERILSLFLEPSLFNWKHKYHIEILCNVSCCRKTEMETQGQVWERTLKFTEGEASIYFQNRYWIFGSLSAWFLLEWDLRKRTLGLKRDFWTNNLSLWVLIKALLLGVDFAAFTTGHTPLWRRLFLSWVIPCV